MFDSPTQDAQVESAGGVGRTVPLRYHLALSVYRLRELWARRFFLRRVQAQILLWHRYSNDQRQNALHLLRSKIRTAGFSSEVVAEGFGWMCAQSANDLELSDSVVVAARSVLQGRAVELIDRQQRFESLVLAALIATLARLPVHVFCNRPEIQREYFEALIDRGQGLDLSIATLASNSPKSERQATYGRDIVVAQPAQVAMDQLAGRLLEGPTPGSGDQTNLLTKRAGVALLDDVETLLFDQADVPVVLYESGSQPAQIELYRHALELARPLVVGMHLSESAQVPELTAQGRSALELMCAGSPNKLWRAVKSREYLVTQALIALHCKHPGEHYDVRNDAVVPAPQSIADWTRELLCLVSLKEGVATRHGNDLLARTSYQRFFAAYRLLGGVGSAASLYGLELYDQYRMLSVPDSGRPLASQKVQWLATYQQKLELVVELIRQRSSGLSIIVANESFEELVQMITNSRLAVRCIGDIDSLDASCPEHGVVLIREQLLRTNSAQLARWLKSRSSQQLFFCELPATQRQSICDARQLMPNSPINLVVLASAEDGALSNTSAVPTPWMKRLCNRMPALAGYVLQRQQRRVQRMQLRSRQQIVQMDSYLSRLFAFCGKSGF